MMNQLDLMYFLAVARSNSVSGAAAELFVSQPAVSRRIASLERSLGLRLFRRTPSGMVPTAAGERLQALAQDLHNRLERASDVMGALGEGQHLFTVACPETTGNYFVAPFIATGAPISDILPSRPADVYGLLDTGADMAVNTMTPPAQLRSQHLLSTPILVHFPGNAPFPVTKGQAELKDVARFAMQMPGYGSAVERNVRAAAGRSSIDLSLATPASNGILAQAQAAAGRGASIAIEPAAFGLNEALLIHEGDPLAVDIHAAWESDHYAAPELEALAKELATWMKYTAPQAHSNTHHHKLSIGT
ncbi:LysR family transcriptional regulator [Paeniglutamicibacter kerguelensis]|uniref:DNA-binding transcriptional LysR family regulator n=2 Tax=Paeniglutamicibacter kerguelensis TaxID=254788 RepID=A0ABS4XH60_9MICC|nr:LysR family transcriptional regulator [Paeniglutamicibacter kerguelensis]MBP2387810.1 DNA-binding transcriptional LysR family regulator [Paeniglutamicibacter kerguelensis]